MNQSLVAVLEVVSLPFLFGSFPFSAYLGTPLRVLFFLEHGCVVLGLCYIDAVRQPSLFLAYRDMDILLLDSDHGGAKTVI